MKRIALCLATLMLPAVAFAQTDDPAASINVLITPASYSGCSDAAFNFIDAGSCADLTSAGSGSFGFVWVVASREGGWGTGIGGAQFGLSHNGLASPAWTLCTGGSEIPEGTWPGSGSGNAVTWGGGCYASPGNNAKIGFLSVGVDTQGSIAVISDPRSGSANGLWADCDANLWYICTRFLGSADLASGTSPSCGDPAAVDCVETPVQETSWGSIKALFN